MLIVLLAGSVMLESTFTSFHEYLEFLLYFEKNVEFSDTKASSDLIFSSLSSRDKLFAKKEVAFFPKSFLSVILLTSDVGKYFLRSFLYNLPQKCFLYFFKDSIVFFLK